MSRQWTADELRKRRLAKRLRERIDLESDNDYDTTMTREEWQTLLRLMAQAAVALEADLTAREQEQP